MNTSAQPVQSGLLYPLPIARALADAERECAPDGSGEKCHDAVMRLAGVIAYYLGAVAVARYSQALLTGEANDDPTLNRSLRNLRRVLMGQWLGWTARALAAAPEGGVEGLAGWYTGEREGPLASAYETLRKVMLDLLGYTGEYGPREKVSPRLLLELIDQYRIRLLKAPPGSIPPATYTLVAHALLAGLRDLLSCAEFLPRYELYAPMRRQMLMGVKPTTPMPPIQSPAEVESTLLLYPPGEAPDYTRRPDLQNERLPLFPLDPLLVYTDCSRCGKPRVAALQEVAGGSPTYLGLDPDCGHALQG